MQNKIENKVAIRLALLEAYCKNAGLVNPLTKEDIHFIEVDKDDSYNEMLSALVNAEVNKQKLQELREPVVNEPTKELQTKKYRYCITASYEVETDVDITAVKNNYEQKCKNMAPNTFKNIIINAI